MLLAASNRQWATAGTVFSEARSRGYYSRNEGRRNINGLPISRAQGSLTFPANFQLVAAMNPCPWGQQSKHARDY
jgi:hypothetical protein